MHLALTDRITIRKSRPNSFNFLVTISKMQPNNNQSRREIETPGSGTPPLVNVTERQ